MLLKGAWLLSGHTCTVTVTVVNKHLSTPSGAGISFINGNREAVTLS